MSKARVAWCWSLASLSGFREGNPDPALVEEAKEKASIAESYHPGAGAYFMACIRALKHDFEGCQKWLEAGRQTDRLPSCKHMATDKDLDNVRDQNWFQDFMKSNCP